MVRLICFGPTVTIRFGFVQSLSSGSGRGEHAATIGFGLHGVAARAMVPLK